MHLTFPTQAAAYASRHSRCVPPLPDWQSHRLVVQFHGKVPLMYFRDEVLPLLPRLRQLYAAAGCPLVVYTLLRQPVPREVSFFRFFRANRGISMQEWLRHDCNTSGCAGYDKWRRSGEAGEGFWGRDNMQTRALLGWPDDPRPTAWCSNRTVAEGLAVLEQLDLVGTQTDFEASALLLWESLGLRPATAETLGARQMYRQSYSRSNAKWRTTRLPGGLLQQLQHVTRCDQELFDASARRLQRHIASAPRDEAGRDFASRLQALLSQKQDTWDRTQGMVWASGSRCSQPGVYAAHRYDPVCNRSWGRLLAGADDSKAGVEEHTDRGR